MNNDEEKIINYIEKAGKYSIRSSIQGGQNSYAFLAVQKILNRKVFLKIYYNDKYGNNVLDEPKIIVDATINRGNSNYLVQVWDAEKLFDEWILMAMEFIEGGDILQSIRNGGLRQMEAVEITKKVLMGLGHFHSSGFLHRDIKPANIILKKINGQLIPKIGDFGSAVKITPDKSSVSASKHSRLYVPPEGWENPSSYSAVSDIYQVGLVLFEMVNGPLPYEEDAYLDQIAKREMRQKGYKKLNDIQDDFEKSQLVDGCLKRHICNGRIVGTSKFACMISNSLRRIIRKAVHVDKLKRYQSTSSFLAALNSLDIPNWENEPGSMQDCILQANNFRNCDWQVKKRSNAGKRCNLIIKRAKKRTGNFRKWGEEFDSLSRACEYVERKAKLK